MKSKTVVYIFVAIIAIFGIVLMATGSSSSDTELVNVESISASQMDNTYDYEITEAYIFDSYAQYEENGTPKTYYMAVVFYDATGTLCMTSMELEKGDDIYQEVMDYLDDDSMYVGDLVLPLYCSASSFSSSSEVGGYFSEYATEIALYGYETQQVWLQLDYMGSTLTEYQDEAASSSNGSVVMGVIFLVFAGILLVLSIVSGKKAKARAAAQQTAYQTVPAQPTCQMPPQYPTQPQAPARPTGVCPTCGEKVKSGSAFCGNCGTRL